MTRVLIRIALGVLLLAAVIAGLIVGLNLRGEDPLTADTRTAASPEQIERGAYLARVGNCEGCHSERGGAAYAGGRGVPTPFGTVYAPNLTPDTSHGLGAWSTAEFWRALHHGRSRDGRLLYPAFPYPNYTRVTRADSDAIFAYLSSLPAVAQPNRAHTLQFPFDRQAALAVWRALYFRPAQGEPEPEREAERGVARSAAWRRGAYLVEGLGHCNACHASRNALGATSGPLDLAGGLIPVQNWYAPSLASSREAGVADWTDAQVIALLKTGVSERGAVKGPMSEVVSGSTQHWSDADLAALAVYLKALPSAGDASPAARPVSTTGVNTPGARLYERHCASCHGDQGEGAAGAYPALAGRRAVTLPTPANLVHVVLEGGFPPVTAGNPRPYGMPPFATVLSNDEVAQVLTHIRTSWGNSAAPVSALEASRFRSVQ